ncbi:MAG: amino acid adenylation domain-containing protein [Nostoc sp.]|uniref:non-ribosomal peptide synthetase n=1 Tax=Nostoc sp. TaxID=1180 RepID=UPI002FF5E5F9
MAIINGKNFQVDCSYENYIYNFSETSLIHQIFETQVLYSSNNIAIELEAQCISYQELNQRANQLAYHLQVLGVQADIIVGLCLERSLELIIAILAILKAGGAYLPIDPNYPAERTSFMLDNSQVSILLTKSHLCKGLSLQTTYRFCLDNYEEALAQNPTTNPQSEVTPDNLAYVIYTSGSTGKPKGVAMPHRPLVNLIAWQWQNSTVGSSAKTLQYTPISFDVSFQEIFATLTTGGTLVLISEQMRRDPIRLLKFLNQAGIERLFLPFVALQQLAEVAQMETIIPISLSEVITAGEQLRITTAIAHLFSQLTNCSLHNHYGPSETHVITALRLSGSPQDWPILPAIGQPIANTQIHLLDSHLQPVPVGVPGELYVGGVSLARGYFNRPDLTAERFIVSPFDKCERLYKTGDLAKYLADGNIQYLGRIDQQVKIRGYRIEPGEIETVLEQYPQVRQAVVITREDVPGEQRLVAYVVGNRDAPAISLTELRQFLRTQLPEYMIPSAIALVEKLLLTPSGKVDRNALPVPSYETNQENWVAPQTPAEMALANIWADILGLKQVGIYDHFLDLGGHSLLATQVISRIRDVFQVELPLRCLLESAAIADLTKLIETDRQQIRSTQILPIQPVGRDANLPLAFVQEPLWFLDQLVPNNPFYNVPEAFCLNGFLNVQALEQSFQEIINRHEIIRTTFKAVDGQPIQVIHPSPTFKLPVIDSTTQESQVWELIIQEARRSFDLSEDLMLRTALFKLSETEHFLLINLHHIVCDGWSINVLLKELGTLYTVFALEQTSPLSDLTIQYADFVVWQRQWLQGEIREHQLAYWQQQLNGLPPIVSLPTDFPRPLVSTYRGARHFLSLSTPVTKELQELSRREGATLFMTLLTAFQTLLFYYTGQDDIAIGSLVANRHRPELEKMLGFFANTIVLRTDLSGCPSFRQLLHRVREVTLEAYAHQDLPFEELVQTLQPDRTLNHNPLVQVVFNLQNTPRCTWEVPGVTLTHLPFDNKTVKFDLFLELTETPTGLVGYFEYSTDLFAATTIARMAEHFQKLLKDIVVNLDAKVSDICLLSIAEQQQFNTWNQTQGDFPQECIHQLFAAQVEQTPDAIAIEFAGQHLTYRELNQQANQLAHYLQTLGVKPDVVVGICIERSPQMAIGLLGILKAGGAYLPLDPAYPQERLAFLLNNSQVSVLLAQQNLIEKVATPNIRIVYIDSEWEALAQNPTTNPQSEVTPDNLAYVIYTSGSTGKPKGVAMPHRPLVNLIAWQWQNSTVGSSAKTLQYTPISFDVSFQEIFATLTTGGTLVLISEQMRRDPIRLLKFLNQAGIERLFLPFVALQQLAEVAQMETIIPISLSEVITAGEQLRITTAIAHLFSQLTNCSLHNHYGPSETHVITALRLSGSPQDWPILPAIGQPIANTQIHLLDSHLQPVPVGVPGELYVGGVSLARGYFNRPDLTAERFIVSPFDKCERLYKTGDLAKYLADGNIQYLGRIDQQVKIRGYRIEPGEIETVLNQYPAVKETVAIVREDQPGEKHLVAYLCLKQQESEDNSSATSQTGQLQQYSLPEITTQNKLANNFEDEQTVNLVNLLPQLRAFLKQKLPEYMIPAAFVAMEALPITPSGKVDRRALPVPNRVRPNSQEAFVTPRNYVEQRLAEIATQILGLEQIGIHDNFFDLGGYSLLLARMLLQVQKTFQIELSLQNIFIAPSIAELSKIITAIKAGDEPALTIHPTFDLQADAILDPTINSKTASLELVFEPVNVLLTGATGFLGAFLLHELLEQTQVKVHCLIRANNIQEGSQRIKTILESYKLWNQNRSFRIIPVIGDISLPLLGLPSEQFKILAETIDTIYHNGALVNFVYPYSVLKAANVLGTQEVLRLASRTKIKPVHFLSTVGVFSPTAYTETQVILEQEADRPHGLYGYTQSKWVAEKLVTLASERGIPTTIYRPTWIEGHSQTGICNRPDFLRSLIKGCIQLGLAPDWNMPVDIVPVDYISRAIIQLSKEKALNRRIFHISNPQSISWNQLVNWIQNFGYSIQQIPFEDWLYKVIFIVPNMPENALYPFLSFLSEKLPEQQQSISEVYFQPKSLQFDTHNTVSGLVGSNITCPPVDNKLLNTYFSYFIHSGFLESPLFD